MRRGRTILTRAPWAVPLLAMLCSAIVILVIGGVGGQLSPLIPYPRPLPTPEPAAKPVLPLAYETPVPINYGFYDWMNIDYQNMFPEAGPMGSLAVFGWRRIHIGDNQFDWRPIDSYLEAAQHMTVTLSDGRVISKPVIIEIIDNESAVPSREVADAPHPPLTPDSPYFFFADYTPPWIRDRLRQPIEPITYVKSLNPLQIGRITNDMGSYLVTGRPGRSPCGWPVVAFAPKYNHPLWLTYYKQMVYALGQRYDRDPRVAAIVFGPGIDSEFGHATKPYFGCDLKTALYEQSGMSESEYLLLTVREGPLNDIADWYRDAFPTKPIYLQFTSAGKSVIDRLHAQGHNPPIGLKQATLIHDNNNQWQSDGNGTIQIMMRYSTTHSIAWENAFAYTGGPPKGLQIRYFSLLAGLTSFPTFMDFIGNWALDLDSVATGMFAFQRQYLGRTITNTDEVWIALRDTEFWPPTRGAVGYGGWHDDFTYGLYRPDGIPGNETRIITTTGLLKPPFNLTYPITTSLYSLIARRTDMASGNPYMSFAADHRWQYWGRVPQAVTADGVYYDFTLKYVDLGTDNLAIEYMDYGGITRTRSIRKRNSGQWVTTTVTIRDAYLNGQFPGGTDFRLSAEPDRGGLDEIVHMVMVKGHVGAEPTPTPVVERPTRTPLPVYERRVNAGGEFYVDTQGHRWLADQPYTPGDWGYVGGKTYSAVTDVSGMSDPLLYRTERWWADGGSYQFDVPNGLYRVELRFAETLRDRKDQRLFDVLIEGQFVLQNFDLFSYGGYLKAVDLSFQTVVTDGQLTIDFIARRDAAKVNALRVLYLSADTTPVATPTPTRPAVTPTPRPATPTPTRTPPAPPPTPVATPTLTIEQRLDELEERFRALDEIVQQLLKMLP